MARGWEGPQSVSEGLETGGGERPDLPLACSLLCNAGIPGMEPGRPLFRPGRLTDGGASPTAGGLVGLTFSPTNQPRRGAGAM